MTRPESAFYIAGPETPQSPILLSVPHAGRSYDPQILATVRPHSAKLHSLEDRFADILVQKAIEAGTTAIIAKAPRLVIDLNRDETDLDPGIFCEPIPHSNPMSQKARGGLGLIPSRTALLGELWKSKLTRLDLQSRLQTIHRPYHAWLASQLQIMRDVFGEAILLDIHSMPSLNSSIYASTPKIVIGDLHGRSCRSQLTNVIMQAAQQSKISCALNAPYPGNYILKRHNKPGDGIHAIQVEFDRSLYLNSTATELGHGIHHMQTLLADIVKQLEVEILSRPLALAAE